MCILSIMMLSMFYLVDGATAETKNLNSLLRGQYALSNHFACVGSSQGFAENSSRLGDGSSSTAATRGIVTYNGDGTGSVTEGHMLGVIHDATSAGKIPVFQTDYTCNLTYTVNPGLWVTFNRTCNGKVVTGPLAGATYTSSGTQNTGQMSSDGTMILLSDTERNVETAAISFQGKDFTNYSICNRSGMEVKLPAGKQ